MSKEAKWCNITERWYDVGKSEMTFVDLFCGAGGLSKGLEMAGLHGICGLDFLESACHTYERNFKHPFIFGDIKEPKVKEEFYETVKKELDGRELDVVAGGFPCQGFSMAGNRVVDDPRNSLYKELIEIVSVLRPKYILCENVKGIKSMLGGAVVEKIISDFKEIGYDVDFKTLCAADFRVPQKRERVIFIGNRVGVENCFPLPIIKPYQYVRLGDAIVDLMDHPNDPAFNHIITKHSKQMQERIKAVPEGKSLYPNYTEGWKKSPWDEPSCTVKENHGGTNLHPKLPRVLTPRELARLQSFPDSFIFCGTKSEQLVQIGNAVPCLLGKAVGLALRKTNGEF